MSTKYLRCWSCLKLMTERERLAADGHCPHCDCEYYEEVGDEDTDDSDVDKVRRNERKPV